MAEIFGGGGGAALEKGAGLFASKIQGRDKGFFGQSAQAEQALARDRAITGDMFKRSVATFGMNNLIKGEQFMDEAASNILEELKSAREEAMRARASGDMDSYRRALSRQSQLKKMEQEAKIAKQSRIGNILTGIGTAAATILGAALGTFVLPGVGTVAGAGIGSSLATGAGFGAWSY